MTREPAADRHTPGTVINGRYRLAARLGQGGMAEVFQAYQESLDRQVAIKFMHPHLAEDPQFHQRFQREARSVAALRHPHIVQVIDFDWEAGDAYMVMEYVDGQSLEARLVELAQRGERLPLAEAVRIAYEAAQALHYAHGREIVHRDIKPANIMLDTTGRVVITDFGLAKLLSASQFTLSGAMIGTPAYMAPEQVLGQAGDGRVDVYALGVVLYRLVTGQLPFQAETAIALALQHVNQPPLRPSAHTPDLPEGLEAVILKALAKTPEARFQTAAELAAQLAHFLAPGLAPADGAAAPPPARPLPPHNLPPQPTSFVGRQRELAEAAALLRQPEVRLLTLTGPGGTGKTRLSVRLALDLLAEFAEGVCFVPLAELRDVDLVLPAIAQALGVKEGGERPLLDDLKAHLAPRALLLVLDNLEQVLAAGPAVADLLLAAPDLKVLATSRAALRVYGEYEFPVPPLRVPDLNALAPANALTQLTQYPALALFAERARAARPSFALTAENIGVAAEICARLDGLPLAIELAAPRVKLLSLSAILHGLDQSLKLLTGGARDLPARQRSLRGAIEWGYSLLAPEEQTLFARLGVFAGGFTLAAAEAVLPDGGQPAGTDRSLLDGLATLADNSLLRQMEAEAAEPRFALLETLREYALERLAERGELADIQRRHADYCLGLAEALAPKLKRREQIAALDTLEAEHANLSAALAGALARREAELAARLGAALSRFWLIRGYLSEGLDWLDQVRALARELALAPGLRARVWCAIGLLAEERGDGVRAAAMFDEGVTYFERAGDANGAAEARSALAAALLARGRHAEARALAEAGLAAFRAAEDDWGLAGALNTLGLAALARGEARRATELCQESLVLYRKLGDRWGMALALNNLGLAALPQGEHDHADTLVQSSLTLIRELASR